MSRIEARCPRVVSLAEARQRAEQFAREMDERFGLDWRWEGDTVRFAATSGTARGVHGQLALGEDMVTIVLHVPLWLRPFAAGLRSRASALLDETFSAMAVAAER